MPPRMRAQIPLTPHLAPPRRRARVTAPLLEPPVRARAGGAVVGLLAWRYLGIFGSVVEGSFTGPVGVGCWGGVVVGTRTGRNAAHSTYVVEKARKRGQWESWEFMSMS